MQNTQLVIQKNYDARWHYNASFLFPGQKTAFACNPSDRQQDFNLVYWWWDLGIIWAARALGRDSNPGYFYYNFYQKILTPRQSPQLCFY